MAVPKTFQIFQVRASGPAHAQSTEHLCHWHWLPVKAESGFSGQDLDFAKIQISKFTLMSSPESVKSVKSGFSQNIPDFPDLTADWPDLHQWIENLGAFGNQ